MHLKHFKLLENSALCLLEDYERFLSGSVILTSTYLKLIKALNRELLKAPEHFFTTEVYFPWVDWIENVIGYKARKWRGQYAWLSPSCGNLQNAFCNRISSYLCKTENNNFIKEIKHVRVSIASWKHSRTGENSRLRLEFSLISSRIRPKDRPGFYLAMKARKHVLFLKWTNFWILNKKKINWRT